MTEVPQNIPSLFWYDLNRYFVLNFKVYLWKGILYFILPIFGFFLKFFTLSSIWSHSGPGFVTALDMFSWDRGRSFKVNVIWLTVGGLFKVFLDFARIVASLVGVYISGDYIFRKET